MQKLFIAKKQGKNACINAKKLGFGDIEIYLSSMQNVLSCVIIKCFSPSFCLSLGCAQNREGNILKYENKQQKMMNEVYINILT